MKGIEIKMGRVRCIQTYKLSVFFYNPWTEKLWDIERSYQGETLEPKIFPLGLDMESSESYDGNWMTFASDTPFSERMAQRLTKHIAELEIAFEYFKKMEVLMGDAVSLSDDEIDKRHEVYYSLRITYKYPHIKHLLDQDEKMHAGEAGKIIPNNWTLEDVREGFAAVSCDEPFDKAQIKMVIEKISQLEKAFDHMVKP